jgi:hypothetical protein
MDEEQLRQRLDEASWSLLGARVILDVRAREPENLKGRLRLFACLEYRFEGKRSDH